MKKNQFFEWKQKNSILKKTLKIMKLTVFLLLISVFNIFANDSYSQILSLNMEKATLKEVLLHIEDMSEYSFMYSERFIDVSREVSINAENKDVEDILNSLFAETSVKFEIEGRIIILSKSETLGNESSTSRKSRVITGRITDSEGITLPGATISVKGTNIGTITDVNGSFRLEIPENATTLLFSFVGYDSVEMLIEDNSIFDVSLTDSSVGLDEIVVVGFGVQKRVNLTGAVTQIKMNEVMGDRPIVSAAAALQGSVPGMLITGGAQPGTSKVVKLRGTYSINELGDESALILIDNVPGDLDMINPDDIESISVLKDAASTAIYGARAASGVILITTKRPKNDTKFNFNYSFNQGFQTPTSIPQQVSLLDYLTAYKDFGYTTHYSDTQDLDTWIDLVGKYQTNPSQLSGVVGDGMLRHTDGRVYYLRDKDPYKSYLTTGAITNHNFSTSGATDVLRYRLSLGYNRENGPLILDKDVYTRKSLSAFISADIKPWFTQEVNIMYTNGERREPRDETGSGFFNYTQYHSYVPEGYAPAEIIGENRDVLFLTPRNQIENTNVATTQTVTPRIFLKSIFKPLKDLTVAFEYTFNKREINYQFYSGLYEFTTDQLSAKNVPTTGDFYIKRHEFTNYNAYNIYTTYNKTFGKHDIQLIGGFNQEDSYYDYTRTEARDQAVLSVPSFKGGSGIPNLEDKYEEYIVRGGFGRINYSYNDKYLLELNGRYDGSSKFPKKNRYGFFPSASVGWKINKENFMDFSDRWLDELKLRASYGSIGNQNIKPYGYSPTMSVNTRDTWLVNGQKVITFDIPSMVRNNFTWETVKTLDIGLDVAMWKNRLNFTFDWFQRDTDGMLASAGVDLPAAIGANAPMQNIADMRTRGWEFTINYRNRIGNDFSYRASFNIFDATSKITKFANESGLLSNHYKDKSWNEIWGYVCDGYYTIDDFDIDAVKTGTWTLKEGVTSIEGMAGRLRPGDLKFRDINGDDGIVTREGDNTVTNPGDRKVIGNSTPRYNFGSTLGCSYKNFDLSIMLQGVMKRDYALGSNILYPFRSANQFSPLFEDKTDYWKPISTDPSSSDFYVAENNNATYPRIYDHAVGNAGSNQWINTKYLADASYMRIKNVTLSHTFSSNWTRQINIDRARIFVSVENLATFTSLQKGIDPENLSWGYPFFRTISFGANITF